MDWPVNPALEAFDYERGEGRHKHRWKRDCAGFVPSKRGPVGKCHKSISDTSSDGGRRATLAHEIGHLLLDRARNLPAAEVFGGGTPLHLEQRARAFAAELLLPRQVAARTVADSATLDEASRSLQKDYGVSLEVAGWQIRNGPGWTLLTGTGKKLIRQWCRDLTPWR